MKKIHFRIKFCIIMILLMFSLLIGKLLYVQVFNNEIYIDRAYDLWTRNIVVNSRRGNIYDRNGKLIVGNTLAPTVSIIPNQVKNKEETASKIAEILGLEVGDIMYHFEKKVSVETIKPEASKISEVKAKKIISCNLEGVYIASDVIRYYPYGSILSHVLGFVGVVRDFGTTKFIIYNL